MEFWQAHGTSMGIWFIVGMFFFPRLTMLFAVLTPFGWLAWLGWFFAPYLTAAIFATTMYWDTNPFLCVFAWLVAIGGTSSETKVVSTKTTKYYNGYHARSQRKR